MTLHITLAAIWLAGALLLPGRSAAADVRHEIQSSYDRMNRALARKDVTGMFACVAADAQFVDAAGRAMSGRDYKAWLSHAVQTMPSTTVTTKVDTVDVKSGTATAATRERKVLVVKNPRTGENSDIVYDSVNRDTWIRAAGGWRLKRSVVTKQRQTVNGAVLRRG